MLTQSWTELADTREVYEVLFEIRYEYSKMKDSSYKYKIGTISFDESSQAFNEGRAPNFINDSELLHIREEIYDENRRLKLIKQFDIKNSTVEETTFNFQDDVFQSYRTLLNGTLIEEKAHYYTDNNLQKITQCFSPLEKHETKKNVEIFLDKNGFETHRNYKFQMDEIEYETNVKIVYEDELTTILLSNVVPFSFSCSEILNLPSGYYYPNLDDHAQKTSNFKIVCNYEAGKICSIYLFDNNNDTLLEFLSVFEKVIYDPTTLNQSHRIITGIRSFENTVENQFTHVQFY